MSNCRRLSLENQKKLRINLGRKLSKEKRTMLKSTDYKVKSKLKDLNKRYSKETDRRSMRNRKMLWIEQMLLMLTLQISKENKLIS